LGGQKRSKRTRRTGVKVSGGKLKRQQQPYEHRKNIRIVKLKGKWFKRGEICRGKKWET